MGRYAFLALMAILLVLVSGASATWCDATYSNKTGIGIPAKSGGYADGNTIQISVDYTTLSGIQADLDDVRVFDETGGCDELGRGVDGTSTSTDGNFYFFLDNAIATGTDSNGDYALYYNKPSAIAPTSLNFERTEVCNYEDTTVCGFTNADANNTHPKFGLYSMHIGNFSGLITASRVVDDINDRNYSTWFWMDDANLTPAFTFIIADYPYNTCKAGVSDGNFWLSTYDIGRTLPSEFVPSEGVGFANAGAWYKLEISQIPGGNITFGVNYDVNCVYTFSDSDGTVLMVASAVEDQGSTNVIDTVQIQTNTGSILVDNVSYALPTNSGVSLGSETESNELKLRFFDENIGHALVSLSVVFDGNTYTPDFDGNVSIPTYDLSGTQIVSVSEDSNYPTRYFAFDVNNTMGNIDLNLFMLQDGNGQTTLFKFYDTDQSTVLANTLVRLRHDTNICSMRYTNGLGGTSFFLDPDDNYVFEVVRSETDVGLFYPTLLTINIPKDEVSLANITPFDVTGSQLATEQWTNQSAAITYHILSNTTSYYVFDVNGGPSYNSRSYSVNLKGHPTTYTLQPYLTKTADSGAFIFTVKEAISLTPIQGVFIRIDRTIPGEGVVETLSVETDSTGKATIALLYGATYSVYFYYEDSLVHTAEVRPTTTSLFYQVLLDLSAFRDQTPTKGRLNVQFSPWNQNLYLTDGNAADINITVSLTGKDFQEMRITVLDTNRNVWDTNYFSAPWTDGNTVYYSLQMTDFNMQYGLVFVVDVNSTDSNSFRFTFTYSIFDESQWNLLARLGLFAGTQDIQTTSFIAFLITFLCVGVLAGASVVPRDPVLLAGITLAILGVFTFLGFIAIGVMIFTALLAIFLAILTRAVI